MRRNLLGGGSSDEVIFTAPPIRQDILRSATQFQQVTVNNYGLLAPAPGTYDGTNIFYRQHRDNGNAITNLEYLQGRAGVCPLPNSGAWWINAQTNIAAGTSRMVLYDLPSLEAMFAMMQALSNTNGNVRVMGGPAAATITNVSSQIVAANTARSVLLIGNTGTTDGTTATTDKLYIAFGAAAVLGSGTMIPPGVTMTFDVSSGVTQQVVNGIGTSAGNIKVSVQEGI